MEQQEPSRSAAEEALRRLEERLDRASDAAERMIAEAAAAASSAGSDPATDGDAQATGQPATGGPPPAGWQVPGAAGSAAGVGDLDLLMQVVAALRDLIPPELQRRLAEALRELLMALRALIDWYLERNERRRTEPSQVQDIPIA